MTGAVVVTVKSPLCAMDNANGWSLEIDQLLSTLAKVDISSFAIVK